MVTRWSGGGKGGLNGSPISARWNSACVAHGAAVYGVDARTPTLEDVYFEIEARSDAAHLAAAS